MKDIEVITLRGPRRRIAETREISVSGSATSDTTSTRTSGLQTKPPPRITQTVDIGRRPTRNSRARYRTLYVVR